MARQQRAVEVGADGLDRDRPLRPVLAVVAAAALHAREGAPAGAEVGVAGVVLEAGKRAQPRDLAERQHLPHVARRARRRRDGRDVEDAGAGKLGATRRAVAAPEELVAAADGEHRDPLIAPGAQAPPGGGELGRDALLLPILPAADEHEVCLLRQRLPEPHVDALEPDAAAAAAIGESDRVAAVGVDVHQVGVEDDHAEGGRTRAHGRPSPSGSIGGSQ